MPYRRRSFKQGERFGVEYIPNQAHTPAALYSAILRGGNARALLAPVLKRKKAVVYQGCHILTGVFVKNTEDAAFFVKFAVQIVHHALLYALVSKPLEDLYIRFFDIAQIAAETVLV
jgi:hypothetical protein